MKKPVIFFDWDGTLADSMSLSRAGVETALAEMGLPPVPEEKMIYCNGPTIEESAPLLGLAEEHHGEYIRRRYEAEMRILADYQKLFPGVEKMLSRLQEKAGLVIISNGGYPYISDSCRILGVTERFAFIQGLVPGQKKGVTLSQVMEKLRPERAVMVGDRLGDFVAGRQCGLMTVAAAYGYGTAEECTQADVILPTVEALEAWLTAWAEG